LAIGNPADGFFASKMITETGGRALGVSDEEIVDSMKLLAESEGIFAETAGGVSVAVARRLAKDGLLPKGGTTVIAITGNGLKTAEAVEPVLKSVPRIGAKLAEFEALAKRDGLLV
jgi:threonine synthase